MVLNLSAKEFQKGCGRISTRMNRPFSRFLIRWFVCGLGLWVAANILGQITYDSRFIVIVIAGLILAIVNAIIKPVVVILSLPAILFSLGLFMIIINGLMVLLVSWLYPPLDVNNFGGAILAGVIIGLIILSILILVQTRGASLGAGLGGSAGEVNTVRRGADKTLHQLTIVMVVVFALSIILGIIS
jgi:putative membrane protein